MVNEYITLKVSEEFKKTGQPVSLYTRSKSAKPLYQFGFEVFGDFLEKYQDKLIEFKLNIDKNEKAYEYFGESNLKKIMAISKEYINKRAELNMRAYKGEKSVYEEIDLLKFNTMLEVKKLEMEIEKHIAKEEKAKTKPNRNNSEKTKILDKIPFARYPKRFGKIKNLRAVLNDKSEKNSENKKENLSNNNEQEKTM